MVENKLSLIIYFNENPNLEEFHPFRKKLKLKIFGLNCLKSFLQF